MDQVFHKGEVAVQQMAGEEKRAKMVGRGVNNSIVGMAIPFIRRQLIAFAGSTDQEGQLWLSLLVGQPGFIEVPGVDRIVLNEALIRSDMSDILFDNIAVEPSVGLLFIELARRKRFRVNGKAIKQDNKITIAVSEAYANCPKYIQGRNISLIEQVQEVEPIRSIGSQLGLEEVDWITRADTFYVASRSKDKRTDASHRGGNKGFVEVLENGVLRIPDYPGNSMFNTLGNILEDPNVGLLFVDFETGSTLQLTGKGQLLFEQNTPEDLEKTGNTGRFWLFHTEKWIKTINHHQVNWVFIDYSPFNP
jgi:predicted pyridoxine 5'-phosphate oxidase superfamily flavin-nucleotide-binding protein